MNFQTTINDVKSGDIPTNLNGLKRRLWPNYCYHFTNLDNALKILESGYLYSRKQAMLRGIMKNDNANQDIIANTQSKIFDYVRLYFRPQVPTLFDNEGFRARKYYRNAHCPFPVYFLFSFPDVLNLHESCFSPVSLAIHQAPRLYTEPEKFSRLPFDLIYNDSAFPSSERQNYVHHEQAEVIVKQQLSLSYLKKIVVRSVAEKDTLERLLLDKGLNKFLDQIEIDEDGIFFFKRWTYMDDVTMRSDEIKFSIRIGQDAFPSDWNNSLVPLVPDNVEEYLSFKVLIIDSKGEKWRWPKADKKALPRSLSLSLSNINDENYTVMAYLNDQLTYLGKHNEFSDLPF
ncbi:DarT ssDNA thymidine ADP-ribosyltransferase family protein [Lentilactobacillus raoultii]|uniref:DarT ssDNA thymidine ADP-ribosyltransferase family protein n=1 Tax=Lentilactobacillus raoultii TaxID=1987503 RepID=A0ABW3PPJ9_9LACO|nr:DarT ssDNA thymidine ADP-ribosyltransferase family protein [Lentilactobacillus raoultii]